MLNKVKNPLYEQIIASGLAIADFSILETSDLERTRFEVTYMPASLVFRLSQDLRQANRFFVAVNRYLGGGKKSPPLGVGFHITLPKVIDRFRKWLKDDVMAAIEDETIPDLWENARAAASVATTLNDAPRDHDDTFTPDERERVKAAIANFHVLVVQTFKPDAQQAEEISAKLSYLQSAVERLNRFDWKGVALSTIIGIATSLSLDTEKGRLLWTLFQQAASAVQQIVK
jgi:hypothetical protein